MHFDGIFSRDFFDTLVARFGALVLGLVASVITARFLGPDGRGEYYLAITLAAAISQLGNFGLHSSNTYFVAKEPQIAKALWGNTILVSFLGAPVLALFAVAIVWSVRAVPSLQPGMLLLTAAFVPPVLFTLLGSNLLVGMGHVKAYNRFELARAILTVVVLSGFGLAGFGPMGIMGVSVFVAMASGLCLYVLISRLVGDPKIEPSLFRRGLAYGVRPYVACLLSLVLLRGNVFMLGQMSTPAEIGYLAIASQICDVLIVFPTAFATLLFPALVRTDLDRWARTVRGLWEVGGVMILACFVAAILTPVFVPILFGQAFNPAVLPTWALLPGTLGLGFLSVLSQYLGALGMPWSVNAIWCLGIAITFSVSFLLIPAWGATGAAAAVSLGHLSMFGTLFFYARHHAAISVRKS
jgi:O-antigen/teichoic acid export membrane protein